MRNKFEKTIEKKYNVNDLDFISVIQVEVSELGEFSTTLKIYKVLNNVSGAKVLVIRNTLDDIFNTETFYETEWNDMEGMYKEIDSTILGYIGSYLIGDKNIAFTEELLDKLKDDN